MLAQQVRHSAGLAHASNLKELAGRLDDLEMGVDHASNTAANLRRLCAPLLKAQTLLRPWAAEVGVDVLEHSKPLKAPRPHFQMISNSGDKELSSDRETSARRGIAFGEASSVRSTSEYPSSGPDSPATRREKRMLTMARIQEERSSCDMAASRKSHFMANDQSRMTAVERSTGRCQAMLGGEEDDRAGAYKVTHVMA